MPQEKLSLDTIGELDGGRARAVINAAIAQVIADLEDRGRDGKPRTVTVTLTFVTDPTERTHVTVEAGTKIPSYRVAPTVTQTRMTAPGKTSLFFQTDAPDNPDQQTFEFQPRPDKGA